MTTAAILKELNKLPLTERLLVVEKTLKTIRQGNAHTLSEAVESLYNDYKTDKELTIFTKLDAATFYEAR
ncbi:MAG: hypothetical protein JWP69_2357 [Flaviaesturariibacter sp.]|nr:hypothetical protein [Flaviaesturariibacter sp.]